MKNQENRWVILLASHEESFLPPPSSLSRNVFSPLHHSLFSSRSSLLEEAIQRAQQIVPSQRLVVVVSEKQRFWWADKLKTLPSENILVQPESRGTAVEILFALTEIIRRDRLAQVMVSVCNYALKDEKIFQEAVLKGFSILNEQTRSILLLGMLPNYVNSHGDWIIPLKTEDKECYALKEFHPYLSFFEAEEMMEQEGLYYGSTFIAPATTLLLTYSIIDSDLLKQFLPRIQFPQSNIQSLAELYRNLPHNKSFSYHFIRQLIDYTIVLPVKECGWMQLEANHHPAELLEIEPDTQPSFYSDYLSKNNNFSINSYL